MTKQVSLHHAKGITMGDVLSVLEIFGL